MNGLTTSRTHSHKPSRYPFWLDWGVRFKRGLGQRVRFKRGLSHRGKTNIKFKIV
jgi:hypothetical protein